MLKKIFNLHKLRCPVCGKVLLKYDFSCSHLVLEIKCPRCNSTCLLDEMHNLVRKE